MRLALVPLLLLAACGREEAPAANQAPPAPKQRGVAEGDVAAAERLVRRRVGTPGDMRFAAATRSASEGVPIVCGAYEQGGARQRYIVIGGEEAFIEPRMRAGEMDRAVAEFCREGADNGPARQVPPAGEKG